MQLLYTGATKQDAEQLTSDLSLGGYVSRSQIPNDGLSNIFSAASVLSIQNRKRECKMIALKNNETDASNLIFTFSTEEDSICNYKIAFVNPTISGGNSCFEQINTPSALPYYATFQPIVNGSIFNLTSLAANAYLGIWLIREYNDVPYHKKTADEWFSELDSSVPSPSLIERLTFTLDYTL